MSDLEESILDALEKAELLLSAYAATEQRRDFLTMDCPFCENMLIDEEHCCEFIRVPES